MLWLCIGMIRQIIDPLLLWVSLEWLCIGMIRQLIDPLLLWVSLECIQDSFPRIP